MPPVVGFIGGALGIGAAAGMAGAAAGAAFAGTFLGGIVVKLTTTVALSALSRALAPKPKSPEIPGLRTDQMLTGGVNPESFILGRFATAGVLVAPMMSHGNVGSTPNAYLTYVVECGGIPGQQLDGVILNGEAVPVLTTSPHADYGQRLGGRFTGRAWVRYYDGTQSAADPMLLAKYPAPYARPWTPAMVGAGICYAILTFQYDREVFTSFPGVQLVLTGIPLYDPRQDSTAGGSGSQRWANPATWAVSHNLAVMIYNILRGISLPGGYVWGGGIPAADLPYAVSAGAMNACDASVSDGAGGTEAAFTAGTEVMTDDEPFGVIEALLKSCNGALAERGGVWTIRVGGPGLPVLAITDDDLLADAPDDYQPFPPLSEIYNAISATWTDPGSVWQPRDTAPRYDAGWEAEDGGRRLNVAVTLPTVTRGTQAQRLMEAMIKDHRRMRVHRITLPPDASGLEPLDTVAWTSAHNGYAAKTFEVVTTERDLLTGRVGVTLREIDAGDFVPPVVVRPSAPDVAPALPTPQGVPGWAVEAWSVKDGAGTARRPALRASWTATAADDARGIKIALRKSGESGAGVVVATAQVTDGEYIHSADVLPGVAYQMRARMVVDRATVWSAWVSVTAPDVRVSYVDFADTMQAKIDEIAANTTAVAQAELIADTRDLAGNLVLDGTFEQGFAKWPVGVLVEEFAARDLSSGDWVYNAMPAARALVLRPTDGSTLKGTGRIPVRVGEEILLSYSYARASDGVTLRVVLRFFDASGAQLTGDQLALEGSGSGSWQSMSGRRTVPTAARTAEVYVQARDTGNPNSCCVTLVQASRNQERWAAGGLQVISRVAPAGSHARVDLRARASDGTYTGEAALTLDALSDGSSAATVTADLFQVRTNTSTAVPFYVLGDNVYFGGLVEAEFFRVNSLLTISDTGALAAGKRTPADSRDGLFFGQVREGADARFAFSGSRTAAGGQVQSLRLDSKGFAITNADFFYNTATPDPAVRRTTNLAVTTLTGAKMVRLTEIIGGGGGGAGETGNGGNGGTTTVTLYDGATVKQTITASGGAGGAGKAPSNNPSYRQGAPGNDPGNRGGGGTGASWYSDGVVFGWGGQAGNQNDQDWVDVSGWTTPRIAITIGAGGTAGTGSSGGVPATAGIGGAATYQVMTAASVQANPVPLGPTSSGSFAKGDNVAGSFPNLGPGLWVLFTPAGVEELRMGSITVAPGITVRALVASTLTFPSSLNAPSYSATSGARTVNYLFYSMGVIS